MDLAPPYAGWINPARLRRRTIVATLNIILKPTDRFLLAPVPSKLVAPALSGCGNYHDCRR